MVCGLTHTYHRGGDAHRATLSGISASKLTVHSLLPSQATFSSVAVGAGRVPCWGLSRACNRDHGPCESLISAPCHVCHPCPFTHDVPTWFMVRETTVTHGDGKPGGRSNEDVMEVGWAKALRSKALRSTPLRCCPHIFCPVRVKWGEVMLFKMLEVFVLIVVPILTEWLSVSPSFGMIL